MALLCEPCLNASKDVKAMFKCAECEEIYCDKCADYHTKFREFRHHSIIPLAHTSDNKAEHSVYENVLLDLKGQTKPTHGSGDTDTDKGAITTSSDDLATGINKSLNIRQESPDAKRKTVPTTQSAVVDATVDGIGKGNEIYSGSADLDQENKELYLGSADLYLEPKELYSGSDDLDADKEGLYAGADYLDAHGTAIHSGWDVLEEEHVYEQVDDTDQPTGHFCIYVKDSILSRAIGIASSLCLLIVSEDTKSISVDKNGKVMFECSFELIRRYGALNEHAFHFEFGRRFRYGPGDLQFNVKNAKEIFTYVSEIAHRKSGRM